MVCGCCWCLNRQKQVQLSSERGDIWAINGSDTVLPEASGHSRQWRLSPCVIRFLRQIYDAPSITLTDQPAVRTWPEVMLRHMRNAGWPDNQFNILEVSVALLGLFFPLFCCCSFSPLSVFSFPLYTLIFSFLSYFPPIFFSFLLSASFWQSYELLQLLSSAMMLP